MRSYGSPPVIVGERALDFHEFMHWLYLPVFMPGQGLALPEQLEFLGPLVGTIMGYETACRPGEDWLSTHYVYLTAKHGFASPGNPLNRPGWHADGFGTDDINYVWSDRWPTRFATGDFGEISTDHIISAEQFDWRVAPSGFSRWHGQIGVWEGAPNTIYRLDPSVVHSTPIIPEPGGERSFVKVSISKAKYNLRGNSHNHLFDYAWKMWARDELRNDPAYAGGDSRPDA